jgi:uncharacterized protein (TIGR02679 family)
VSARKQVGDPISHLADIPAGLTARQVHTVVTDDDGTERVRPNRRGTVVTREVALVATAAGDPDRPAHQHGHRAVRDALQTPSRRHTTTRSQLGLDLARAGLVTLRAPLTTTRAGLQVGRWTRWERTPAGQHLHATYDTSGYPDQALVAYATDIADASHAPGWPDRLDAAYQQATGAVTRAIELTRTGTSDGWPLSRFAREVTQDTHGLDRGQPLARLVSDALAGADLGSDTPWDQVWSDAGLAVDVLASHVVCVNVPSAGDGPAGQQLTAGADGMPVTVSRQRLTADPNPVAPPPPGHRGWLFAVENEALLSWAWRNCPDTPVVWYGSDAATRLLTAAAAAGWNIAVSADFEPGGLARAASLLARIPSAQPWRLTASDYEQHLAHGTGAPLTNRRVTTPWDPQLADLLAARNTRVTEEDRFDLLATDLRAGQPPDS